MISSRILWFFPSSSFLSFFPLANALTLNSFLIRDISLNKHLIRLVSEYASWWNNSNYKNAFNFAQRYYYFLIEINFAKSSKLIALRSSTRRCLAQRIPFSKSRIPLPWICSARRCLAKWIPSALFPQILAPTILVALFSNYYSHFT